MTGGALPNLLVIGAAKCGTSSLHYYLGLHPQIQMSEPKELSFFIARDDLDPDPYMEEPLDRHVLPAPPNWSRGVEWYRRHFDPAAAVRGESTVAYSFPWYPPVPGRIASVVPDARILYLVRHPFERIASHHGQYLVSKREWRSLPEALASPRNPYVGASRYATVLRGFLDRFPRDQVKVIRQDELLHRRAETLRDVFGFLAVDPEFRSPEFERMRNRSAAKGRLYEVAERLRRFRVAAPVRRLSPRLRTRVEELLAGSRGDGATAAPGELRQRVLAELDPEIAGLEEITGWSLEEWRR